MMCLLLHLAFLSFKKPVSIFLTFFFLCYKFFGLGYLCIYLLDSWSFDGYLL